MQEASNKRMLTKWYTGVNPNVPIFGYDGVSYTVYTQTVNELFEYWYPGAVTPLFTPSVSVWFVFDSVTFLVMENIVVSPTERSFAVSSNSFYLNQLSYSSNTTLTTQQNQNLLFNFGTLQVQGSSDINSPFFYEIPGANNRQNVLKENAVIVVAEEPSPLNSAAIVYVVVVFLLIYFLKFLADHS